MRQQTTKKCFCGSGKKFKNCHGKSTSNQERQISFEYTDLEFVSSNAAGDSGILLTCLLIDNIERYPLKLLIVPVDNGEWRIKEFAWVRKLENIDQTSLAQQLINKAAALVKTTNLWAGEQSENGATIVANEKLVPSDALSINSISFRSNLLNLPSPPWESLWERIEARVENDIYFRVHGFEQEQVVSAISELKKVFPADWVRARYKESTSDGSSSGMGDKYPPEANTSWFPAYHLARTALGAICVDPGWNYFIEIGLSLNELADFNGISTLARKLSKNPGTQHHVCLAAELHKRGYLIGLEPPTGSGSATNDLLVDIDGEQCAIEVKEFTANNPIRKLEKELLDKSSKLPKNLSTPIIFYVVLKEEGPLDVKKENAFVDALHSIESIMPNLISAVVVGTRFIDAKGGRVKRETKQIIDNPKAKNRCNLDNLEELFSNNFDEVTYPCHGIGTFFYFENR